MILKQHIAPAIFATLGLFACGKKGGTEATVSDGTLRAPGTNAAVQATTVSELGLAGALQIKLPDAVKAKSTSLKLSGAGKSIEACLMRESAKQLVSQINMTSSFLCHIEAEGKNIPWNKPALIDFSEMPDDDAGDEPAFVLGIYAKESANGQVEVYVCEGPSETTLTLSQSFKVTGSKSITVGGKTVYVSKGQVSINQAFDDTPGISSSFKGTIAYDNNFSDKDISALSMETKFSTEMDPSKLPTMPPMELVSGIIKNSFGQKFSITAKEGGKTKLAISELGTYDDGDNAFNFKKASVGLFDAVNGNVYYAYDDSLGQAGNGFSSQACVDAESNLLVDNCAGAKFQTGGSLHLEKSEVPEVLAPSFSPEAPSGFDCKPSEWVKIKLATDEATLAAHDACDKGLDTAYAGDSMNTCFTGDYVESPENVEITFEVDNEDDFESMPDVSDDDVL